jgi:hypothetical protein
MRKASAILVIGLVIAIVGPAGAANAAKPERFSFPVDDVIRSFDVCSFPMRAHVVGKNHLTFFVDDDGDVIRGHLAGQLSVTFTRKDTGVSRRFTISGPSFFDASGTIVRGTGRWATPTVDGTFVIASGNLMMDATGAIVEANGNLRDLCELMA